MDFKIIRNSTTKARALLYFLKLSLSLTWNAGAGSLPRYDTILDGKFQWSTSIKKELSDQKDLC